MFYPYIVVVSRVELCSEQTGLEHFVLCSGKPNQNMQEILVHIQNERFTPSKLQKAQILS